MNSLLNNRRLQHFFFDIPRPQYTYSDTKINIDLAASVIDAGLATRFDFTKTEVEVLAIDTNSIAGTINSSGVYVPSGNTNGYYIPINTIPWFSGYVGLKLDGLIRIVVNPPPEPDRPNDTLRVLVRVWFCRKFDAQPQTPVI